MTHLQTAAPLWPSRRRSSTRWTRDASSPPTSAPSLASLDLAGPPSSMAGRGRELPFGGEAWPPHFGWRGPGCHALAGGSGRRAQARGSPSGSAPVRGPGGAA